MLQQNKHLTRRDFLAITTAGMATSLMGGCNDSVPLPSTKPTFAYGRKKMAKPNIIFIMADDMGYGDLGCYNPDSKIPTPNMDRLAKEGMRFTDAHSPDAVCTPTRYSVLTGKHCWRSGFRNGVLWSGYDKPLITDELTVGRLMQKNGYKTAAFGKWHLGMSFQAKDGSGVFVPSGIGKPYQPQGAEGHEDAVDFTKPITGGPNDVGFDYFFGLAGSINIEPYCFVENRYTVGIPTTWRPKNTPTSPDQLYGGESGLMVEGWKDKNVGPEITRRAQRFMIKTHRENPNKPFFMYYASPLPHMPCVPAQFSKGASKAGVRGDVVSQLDWTIGQIISTLKQLGIEGNTLIMVTSDNGAVKNSDEGKDFGHKSCGDFRDYKGQIYEGGHRVPLIAKWPGNIKPDTISDEVICLTDLMHTCAAVVGAKLPNDSGQDSYNILPVLLGRPYNKPLREATMHMDWALRFSIRQGDWKLVKLAPDEIAWDHAVNYLKEYKNQDYNTPPELYNLVDDPAETTNLAKKHPEIVKRLNNLIEKYKAQGRSRSL